VRLATETNRPASRRAVVVSRWQNGYAPRLEPRETLVQLQSCSHRWAVSRQRGRPHRCNDIDAANGVRSYVLRSTADSRCNEKWHTRNLSSISGSGPVSFALIRTTLETGRSRAHIAIMARMVEAEIRNGTGWTSVHVDDALTHRDLEMRCPECHARVKPHAPSRDGRMQSHFEHFVADKNCRYSSAYTGATA
jgi:hypothetical protein